MWSPRFLNSISLRERRTTHRDRRPLDATMKFCGTFTRVVIANLSESGAYVIAPTLPVLSDSITLNINLPEEGASVMVSGRVRRVALASKALQSPGGFGVEFTRFYSPIGRLSLLRHLAPPHPEPPARTSAVSRGG